MRSEPDIDRQHPEFAQHLQEPLLRRDRQREDHEIETRVAREFDEIVDGSELWKAADYIGRTVIDTIVEEAADAQIGALLRHQVLQHLFRRCAAADDDRAPIKAADLGEVMHDHGDDAANEQQDRQPAEIPGEKPDARENPVKLQKEDCRECHQEDKRPSAGEPEALIKRRPEGAEMIDVERFEREERKDRHREDRDVISRLVAPDRRHVERVNEHAARRNQDRLDDAGEAGKHDR